MFATTLTDHLPEIALAAALAWGSGLRVYLVLFLTGMAGFWGWLELPAHLAVLAHPAVLGASGLMLLIEQNLETIRVLEKMNEQWERLIEDARLRIEAGAE